MTARSLLSIGLQLIGVFLFCDLVAGGMSFTLFRASGVNSMSPDWTMIVVINAALWLVGLALSAVLIFFSVQLATLLCGIGRVREDSSLTSGPLTSEVLVQIFAAFLLVRQVHMAIQELILIFGPQFVDLFRGVALALYYAATIALSIWLLRHPDWLLRIRKSKPNNNEQNKPA